jgi:hypothetical protein
MKHIWIASILVLSAVLALVQKTNAQESTHEAQSTKLAEGMAVSPKPGAVIHKGTGGTPTAQNDPTPALIEPTASGEPHTEMLDTNAPTEHDALLEPRPLPRADLSLIGGTVRKVDAVRNRIAVTPFGGGNTYLIYFDDRTRILSAGRETTVLAIHPGDRIYADTQLLNTQVFARTLQVRPAGGAAQASGQVVEVLAGHVRMQDRLSGEAIQFEITDQTKVEAHGKPVSAAEIHSGSLISVAFVARKKENNEAQSIKIEVAPGESFVFAGTLTNIDLRDGVLALDNQMDGNNYELYFDPRSEASLSQLVVGAPVSVTARFDGKRYRATSIKVSEPASSP